MVLVAPPSGLILTRQRPSLLSCAFADFLVVCHCCVCFLITLQRYCFFLICANFWYKKMYFLYHFSNIGHTKGKMQHANTHKKTRRAIAARRGTHKHNRYISMKPNAKILHINDICKRYLYFCKLNSQKPSCHVASDHTHSAQSYR